MLLFALLACATPAPKDTAPAFSYPMDDTLRLNHVQVKGTHNSYHIEPKPLAYDEWAYTQAPLDVQAQEQGVRQFEIDVHYDADTDELQVYHVVVLDQQSTCFLFSDCLGTLAAWSAAHPAHMPVAVMVEPKDDAGGDFITDYDAFDNAILDAFPDVITPAEVRGDSATLRERIVADGGWPFLGQLRGRVFFVLLDSGKHRDNYMARGEGLMFPKATSVDDDFAAYFLEDDPLKSDIATPSAAGFLVRTRADNGTQAPKNDPTMRDAALASAANFLSTDFPAPVEGIAYAVEIPGGTPARCNAATAPSGCTSEAIEDPAFME